VMCFPWVKTRCLRPLGPHSYNLVPRAGFEPALRAFQTRTSTKVSLRGNIKRTLLQGLDSNQRWDFSDGLTVRSLLPLEYLGAVSSYFKSGGIDGTRTRSIRIDNPLLYH
jgi:hypothetical protein